GLDAQGFTLLDQNPVASLTSRSFQNGEGFSGSACPQLAARKPDQSNFILGRDARRGFARNAARIGRRAVLRRHCFLDRALRRHSFNGGGDQSSWGGGRDLPLRAIDRMLDAPCNWVRRWCAGRRFWNQERFALFLEPWRPFVAPITMHQKGDF